LLKIFISYRRADTLGFASRIGERLRAKYGVSSVYIDVDTIPLAADFREHIISAIKSCDVLLVLIGQRWMDGDPPGSPCRLFEPTDFVRLEIEAALSCGIPVVPLLVGNAQLPTQSQVPPCLAPLLYRTGFHIDEGPDFHHHIAMLISRLNKDIKPTTPAAPLSTPPIADALPETKPDSAAQPAERIDDRRGEEALRGVDSRAPPGPDGERNLAPIRLSLVQGVSVVAFLLLLNSIMATLGSMLWSYGHYWPAYMVSALACAYFRLWGLLVVVLSPIASMLVIGGTPAYLYLPSNALQGVLIIAAFVLGRIDPSLPRLDDKIKYLTLAIVSPSICGALLAWWLRRTAGVGASDPDALTYTLLWVVENFMPAVFPGIWLHGVVGSLRKPSGWARESRWAGWVGLTLAHAVPGAITLFLSIGIALFLVASRLGEIDVTSNAWDKVHVLAGASATFRWLVLATSVSLLVFIGVAVRHARHAWQLEEAIRRQMPSKEEAERILSGTVSQSKRKTVSLIVFNLNNFGDAARSLRPQMLVSWLNAYFDCLAAAVERFGGQVEYFNPEKTLVVFGFHDEEGHANSSMQCAIDALGAFRQISTQLAGKEIMGLVVTMGVHSGSVVAGEIGSRDRRHYTIVGDTVDMASQVAREAQGYANEPFAVLFSIATIKEAGLLTASPQRIGLTETSRLTGDGTAPLPLYSVTDASLLRQSLILDSARSI
jgi:class 3 adenylate cyclase